MNNFAITTVAGGVLCLLACLARADVLPGVYTYKLVLRDDQGFVLRGTETPLPDERVSSNYKFDVFNSSGELVGSRVDDVTSLGSNRTTGCNCTLSVSVGEGTGYATVGEQLTLVVTTKYDGTERFRSSTVLPPVGGSFGFAKAPVGVFFGEEGDVDGGWGSWLRAVNSYLPSGNPLGAPDDDYDADGLSNIREYQLGTDPAGGALGLKDKPEFTITEQDGAYKVSFNYDWSHVYSIRVVEGATVVGVDGQDLPLYENAESLGSDTAWGTYFYNNDYESGAKTFFVKKPEKASYLIGLAVDGRLQEYIQVGDTSLEVSPGFPLEYESEEKATAAKAMAAIVPTEQVAAVLTGEGMVDAYKAMFTAEAVQKDDKWLLSAELTPEAWTNLMENATAATCQLPVGEIAMLESEATTNAVVTGCTPGFYYSLCSSAVLKNISPDAEGENLGVLCGADGVVEFPKIAKPGDEAGFYKVVISVASGE